jgi:hypothetical protein
MPTPPFSFELIPIRTAIQVKAARRANRRCIVCHRYPSRVAVMVMIVGQDGRDGFGVCANCAAEPKERLFTAALKVLGYKVVKIFEVPLH